MESLTSGTMVGTGSFRCRRCGYVLALIASDALPDCPGCGGRDFVRASLFSAGGPGPGLPYSPGGRRSTDHIGATEEGGGESEKAYDAYREEWLRTARERVGDRGDYLAYTENNGEVAIIALVEGWTRIGRSLAADVRLDDPTVSRRHALIDSRGGTVRVLDDRSLNGVFLNGERIESRTLQDGDELTIGRYSLRVMLGERVGGDDREQQSGLSTQTGTTTP